MANQNHIDQVAERVERLLVRYAELQRTNVLLTNQVDALTQLLQYCSKGGYQLPDW